MQIGTPITSVKEAIYAPSFFIGITMGSYYGLWPDPFNFCLDVKNGYNKGGLAEVPIDSAIGCATLTLISGLVVNNAVDFFLS